MKQDKMKKLGSAYIIEKVKNLVMVEWEDPTWHSDKNVFDNDFELIK